MRWRGERQSDNIDDQRGAGGFSGGSPGRMGMGIKAGGVGGFGLIILVILAIVFGVDPTTLLQMAPSGQGPSGGQAPSGYSDGGPSSTPAPHNDEMKQFVAAVLGNTEDVWNNMFQKMGATYEEPQLVMFSGMVRSACGMAQSASGPFYCPLDHKLYLDTSFFDELDRRFGAPGDFAQAYVIAHEVGHHVQNLLGILPKVEQLKQQVGRSEANALSVRVELQADCFAGVWANQAQQLRQILEAGDIEEGIRAAGAVGDDRIQKQTQGYVVPDGFTHGSSAQRAAWFRKGLQSGDLRACDTFNTAQL